MSSIEERLERIEKMLSKLSEKLEYIENKLKSLGIYSDEFGLAVELMNAFSIPAILAIESASRLISVLTTSELDSISRDILKTLSTCEKLSVSEVTRRMRGIRGKASRRIVRSRLFKLEENGYVLNIGSRERPLYVLKKCIESER